MKDFLIQSSSSLAFSNSFLRFCRTETIVSMAEIIRVPFLFDADFVDEFPDDDRLIKCCGRNSLWTLTVS